MRKYFHSRLISFLALSCSIISPVFAGDKDHSGWFFGLSMLRSEPTLVLPNINFSTVDHSAQKFSAVYQFDQHWKTEINYLDVLKPSLTFSLPTTISSERHGKGLQLLGIGSMAVTEKFSLFGKAGALHSNLENICATSILICNVGERGTDVNYGIGLRYDFTNIVSVRGEWERLHRIGSSDAIRESDRDFFSVGVGFKF